jgi:hypothetical protein
LTGGEFHSYHFGYKNPIPQEAGQVRMWWAELSAEFLVLIPNAWYIKSTIKRVLIS